MGYGNRSDIPLPAAMSPRRRRHGGLAGPSSANKDPVTPQQLKAYQDAFMAEVKKGDLLFHGDAATAKSMGVTLSTTGWACAMCHPMGSDTHPHAFPKFQRQWLNSRRCAT